MDISRQKEQFGEAYVRAVAAVAGFGASKPEVDDDSIDLCLFDSGAGGSKRSPRLEMQLKSTSSQNVLQQDHLAYPLSIKNYDDLRPENLLVPRILVVTLLPDAITEWLNHSEQELALRRCTYWFSLRGMSATVNQASVTVHLPRHQHFTVQALQDMMHIIGGGGAP